MAIVSAPDNKPPNLSFIPRITKNKIEQTDAAVIGQCFGSDSNPIIYSIRVFFFSIKFCNFVSKPCKEIRYICRNIKMGCSIEDMNVEEFEKRAETIVDDELNNIKTMLRKIPDPKRKRRLIDLVLVR